MNLHRLTQYRVQLEEILRADLLRLDVELHDVSMRARSASQRLEMVVGAHAAAMREGLAPDAVETSYAEIAACEDRLRQAARMLEETRLRWEAQRAMVFDAARERQKLERLERRQALRARLLVLRHEQRTIDEAAQMRFLRNKRREAVTDAM